MDGTWNLPQGDLHDSALIAGADHYFYGTAYGGGRYNFGTVFRMSHDGDVQVLYAFDGSTTGGYPAAPLLQASDGLLYGTTSAGFWGTTEAGPASGFGTLFRIDRRGTLTVVHAFDEADGSNPVAPLIQADDGDLYGTAALGGAFGGGVAFRLSPLAVTVVAPNGGEALHAGQPTNISWTAGGAPAAFDVELSRDGGNTFRAIRHCTALDGSTRSCTWRATGPPTPHAIVRVTTYDANGGRIVDTSDASFGIRVGQGEHGDGGRSDRRH